MKKAQNQVPGKTAHSELTLDDANKAKAENAEPKTSATAGNVKFNKEEVIRVLGGGIGWRSIRAASDFVDEMGFELAVIKTIEKTHESSRKIPGGKNSVSEFSYEPRTTITHQGHRVTKVKGIFCYDFLFWFAANLGIATTDLPGGRHSEALELERRIVEKLKT